ncbi:putative spermidine synthase [Rosa chinensis]|uniref:Putative spermidine synthase n=1 Tax=Rosa chinensis TaxID=74649 RepID=A0A2P6RKI0_ROSCH|nr:putative spermidine synthase [Rosa chinensis]
MESCRVLKMMPQNHIHNGEASTAREALKHKDVEKVIMCDIDEVIVNFCRAHLEENQLGFNLFSMILSEAELEKTEEKFDVIVGDLPDPIEGGPCNNLYTKNFYEQVIKPHLKDNGIFVTQAGPAGILSHKAIFTSIDKHCKTSVQICVGIHSSCAILCRFMWMGDGFRSTTQIGCCTT